MRRSLKPATDAAMLRVEMTGRVDLSGRALAPTRHGAIGEQRTRVLRAGGDLHDVREAGDARGSRARDDRAVAELAAAIVAPTPHGLVRGERACVVATERQRG